MFIYYIVKLMIICSCINCSVYYSQLKLKTSSNVIHGRFTRSIEDFQIAVPRKVHSNGSFHSHNLSHFYNPSDRKKRDLSGERVHYEVRVGCCPVVLELEPHARLTAPAMLIERRRSGSDLNGITFHQPRRHLCHLRGRVRQQPDSRAAISTCDGLVGYFRTKEGTYFIEPVHGESPVEGVGHSHVIYKRSTKAGRNCNVDDWWRSWCARLESAFEGQPPKKRSAFGTSVQRYYEVMVTADKKFLMFHKDHDVEEYILCIMNIVSDLYHDSSIGNLIDINIVRIIYLEKEELEMDLSIDADGEDTLVSFCKWQYTMNPKDVNHPNHHDVGVLFTRYDICSDEDGSGQTCALLGLAHLGTACSRDQNCCINEDSGLLLGITTAHEMGHTLGCSHDSEDESGCEPVAPAGDSTVMNPSVTGQSSAWSPCSRSFITGLFENKMLVSSQMGECLLDEPQDHSWPLDEMPPGAFYDASEQCAFLFSSKHIHYDQGGDKLCEKLWCRLRDGNTCTSNGEPPAKGTKCGNNKWCYDKKCVEIGERPAAVNGEWGAWGQWTRCTRTCGGGVSSRERLCNNPQPSNNGRYCIGKRHEHIICNFKDCPENSPTFRDTQCSEFDSVPFQGFTHTWKPYSAPDSDPNPCTLYCINEGNVLTKLAPRVKDGTRCKRGTRDTCIQGSCQTVGCDWKIGSDSVEDVCGVCNGDGTHCSIVNGVFKDAPSEGYVPIATVPDGSTNIKLEEVKADENMLAVSVFDNQTFYLNGGYTEMREGEYSFGGGVKGIYSKPQKDLEELHIKGPLKESLVLYVVLFSSQNPGVRYSFAVPSDKPIYSPKYHWEFVEWGPCSAQCGGGTQLMTASCIEERDGKVKPSFCETVPKEEPRARTCNNQPCHTRWKVWKWGPCSGCLFQSGTRTRQVECVKQNPTNKGDEEIITDPAECCGEPPKRTELCNSPHPCPKNMTSEIVKKRTIEVVPISEMIKRSASEGKSFSDTPAPTKPPSVKDYVAPNLQHLEEVMLDTTRLNLTEKEFAELGDELPDKVLSCPIQTLKGKSAIERWGEIVYGPGYQKNTTKVRPSKEPHLNNHTETTSTCEVSRGNHSNKTSKTKTTSA